MRPRAIAKAGLVMAAALIAVGCATPGRGGLNPGNGEFAWKEDYEPYTPSSNVSPALDFSPVWEKYREGILIARTFRSNPPLAVFCVRVDLRSPGVSVIVSPGSARRGCEYRGTRTTSFLKKNRCVVAVNGSVFAPYLSREGACTNVGGLSVAGGVRYSVYGCGPVFRVLPDKTIDFGYPGG
jgi:hypothetical protein